MASIDNQRVAVSFKNGSVGIFNTFTDTLEECLEPGHCETIFDCAFCPSDPDLFATSSYDGAVKLWNQSTLKIVDTLSTNKQVVYGLAWHPSKLLLIFINEN